MVDMSKRLLIVENVLVKIDKFVFPSDFVVIDMLGDPNETMILGKPFLATIHARINGFHREISLVIGEDRILFDMNENVHQPIVFIEKVCMTNSIQKEESFNHLEIGEGLFSYDSLEPLTRRKGKTKMVEPRTVTWKLHSCKPIRVMSEDLSRFLPTYDPNLKIAIEEIQSMKGISTASLSNGIVIVIIRDGTSKVKI
ncbi:zinc finger BED domain-containing protein RICESLEEPER 3 [Tanacetum coccineum]